MCVCKLAGCNASTSIIGSSLVPRIRWGSVGVVVGDAVVVFVTAVAFLFVALVPLVLLRLFVLVAVSVVDVIIVLGCLLNSYFNQLKLVLFYTISR